MTDSKPLVCLGGGIGTVNLIKGLKEYVSDLTVVVSMADEGGSSGRLRRLYNIFPPGDMVSCMAAMSDSPVLSNMLTYRFPGDRYGIDNELGGQKMGNLLMVALRDVTGDFFEAIRFLQTTFAIPGTFLPATSIPVTISAKTIEGKIIEGEEKIDLGKYGGKRILQEIYLHPADVQSPAAVSDALLNAQTIVAGPGDLYTTILPVLITPAISEALLKSTANKIFIVNVANKPFETRDYAVSDYIAAVEKHLGSFPFNKVIVNNNHTIKIPKKYHYSYVHTNVKPQAGLLDIIERDLVDDKFPLYHSSEKLAKTVSENI